METHVSNGYETELTTKKDDKTEKTAEIPITQVCDYKNKTVNLDVDVVAQDIIKGDKDSKPLIEVDDVIKANEALPMEVVDEKPSETKESDDVEMEATPIDAEINSKTKSDTKIVDDESTKDIAVTADDVDSKTVAEQVTAIPDVTSDKQAETTEVSEKVSSEEIVDKNNAASGALKQNGDQNGDRAEVIAEKEQDKIEETKPKAEIVEPKPIIAESESNDTNQPKEVAAIENGAKENEQTDNKENIPVEVKEKENIIEIPIHIDGDIQAAQKPSIVQATNGNGVASKDDSLEVAAAAATNSNKEKMSRIELFIEEKNNDNGQLTETTTHIVKEIKEVTIVKNNVCEAVENVEKLPEAV